MKIVAAILACIVASYGAPSFDSKIVGGELAEKGEFPWQVSVQSPYGHLCGGVLIADSWAMTAAHCIKNGASPRTLFVLGGINHLKETGLKVIIHHIVIHPDYGIGGGPNDIALLHLEEPLVGENMRPIRLPEKGELATGNAWLSGWGSNTTNTNPHYIKDLMKAELPLLRYEECAEELVRTIGKSDPLSETNICTGTLRPGQSSCVGDSGSPLVINKDENATVVGMVSWNAVPCGVKGAPSVHTDIQAFREFIDETMNSPEFK